jgi:NADH-quinone oxidoreductase subunit J
MELAVFYIFASLSVLGALLMVLRRNPLDGAVSLILSLCAVAGLFAMLHAQLLFILQILLYAGAIMVLIIFVIMLLNLSKEELKEPPAGKVKTLAILAAVAAAFYGFTRAIATMPGKRSFVPDSFGNLDKVGHLMLSSYLYPFEIISVVLLVAVVGVVLLAKKEI